MRDAAFDDNEWEELNRKVDDAEKFFNTSKAKREKLDAAYEKENNIKIARTITE